MNSDEATSSLELQFTDVSTELPNSISAVRFHLEDFEGPLDLLLYLIQRAEVNIYDIPVAIITEQYLGYLSTAIDKDSGKDGLQIKETQGRLDDLTQFHVMAATLLQLKSRMLLPLPYAADEPNEDPRRALVEQLLAYQKFKKLSEALVLQQQETHWIITRNQRKILPDIYVKPEQNNEQMSPEQLLAAFKDIISAIGGERLASFYEEFTIKEKIALVHERLGLASTMSFMDLVGSSSALEIICAFWAVLELAKAQQITVTQDQAFAQITLRGRGLLYE